MAGCERVKSCPGLVEVVIRGVCLVLCVLTICGASVYFDGVAHVCGYMTVTSLGNPNVVIGTCGTFETHVRIKDGDLSATVQFDMRGGVGWCLALTFVSAVWIVVAIFHLFLDFQPLSRKKACCGTAWTIFALMDITVLGLLSFGYLCGGVATALLASGSWTDLPSFYREAAMLTIDPNVSEVYMEIASNLPLSLVYDTCALVSALSFVLMLFCIGMIVYFIIARAAFKWATHGDDASEEILP